jgi:hypothetical protein
LEMPQQTAFGYFAFHRSLLLLLYCDLRALKSPG